MSTTLTSIATNIEQISCASYDIAWTGSPVGVITVEVSNTYVPSAAPGNRPVNAGNWSVIPSSAFTGTYPTPSGTANNGALDLAITGFTWVRIVYTPTSGTGSLTVVVAGKVT